MAWARVALLHAAGEGEESLNKTASLFGYKGGKKKPQAATAQTQSNQPELLQTDTHNLTPRDESPRPPARFLRVKKFIDHHPENNSRPQYLTDPNMQLRSEVTGSFSFPLASSLMPPSRLIPFLLTNLGVERESNQLNHKLITKKVSQGKALLRLPYRYKKYWPKRLQIIVDTSLHLEPYWFDFESIVLDLKRQLGSKRLLLSQSTKTQCPMPFLFVFIGQAMKMISKRIGWLRPLACLS